MSVLDHVSHLELQKILSYLEQGLYNHEQWHIALIRTLVCRVNPDRRDLKADAYKECAFGQWYYGDEVTKKFEEHPGFQAIGTAHKNMHAHAINLLNESFGPSNGLSPHEYDRFSNSLEQLRLEIFSLRNEVQTLIFNRDTLTSAINRVTMTQTLREHQELIKRRQEECSLLLIDLDHFKSVNDTHGHVAGDVVLSATAHYMIENLRPYDKIFRYGGEEFLISLPFTGLKEAQEISERLRKGVETLKIDIKEKDPISVTVSIGLALLDPNLPIETSLENADNAMYKAKTAGRNCSKVWEQKDQAPKA